MLNSEFEISYSPKEQAMVSKLAEELYHEDLNSITDIEEDSVSFRTMYVFELADKIEVKVFIINSTAANINFDYLPLMIVDESNELVASEYVNLLDVGEIPPKNIRPYSIFFNKSSMASGKNINDKCRLLITSSEAVAKISNRTTIGYIDENISIYEKRILENYINALPPVIKNSYKFIPYKSGINEDGTKYCILILSNGYERNLQLSNINIVYKNQVGLIQARKKLEQLPFVKSNSTSVFKILISTEDILAEAFEPEKCILTLG